MYTEYLFCSVSNMPVTVVANASVSNPVSLSLACDLLVGGTLLS